MELRTGNEQLRRVNARINTLVEDIREELLARDNTSVTLSNNNIKSLLKYIANPLKNMSIDGNEMFLDDMLDLYDSVIGELDNIVSSKKYSDEKKLSESELKTFEKARDLLKSDRENGIGAIDEVYSEIIRDHKSGKLEDTYIKRKITEDSEIADLDRKIRKVGGEIDNSLSPTLNLMKKLQPEFDLYVDMLQTEARTSKIDEKIETIYEKLETEGLTEEEKETLEIAQQTLLNRKVNDIISSNPEFNKEEYRQGEEELLIDYSDRLSRAFSLSQMNNEELLNQKILANVKNQINIAEYNEEEEKYTISKQTVQDRYFKGESMDRISEKQLNGFVTKFKNDVEELQTAIDSKIDEKSELEYQKEELEEVIRNDIKSSTLTVVPYEEKSNGKEPSEFGKLVQRMAFRFKNPSTFFKKREEVENEMCKAKVKAAAIPLDRRALLDDVEKKQKTFKNKYKSKTTARSEIYKQWDKNRVQNSKDDQSR